MEKCEYCGRVCACVETCHDDEKKKHCTDHCSHACSNHLKPLDSETDMELLMSFRQQKWEEWVEFCKEEGYESGVRSDGG